MGTIVFMGSKMLGNDEQRVQACMKGQCYWSCQGVVNALLSKAQVSTE